LATAVVAVVVVARAGIDASLPDGVRGEVDAIQPPDPLIKGKHGSEKQTRAADFDTIFAVDE
jgi:hypothetical protein